MKILKLEDFGLRTAVGGDAGTALSSALAACRPYGGMVVIPAGSWLTGPLEIPSGTTLRLEAGSILEFRNSPSAYLPVPTRWEGVECYGYQPLLSANDARDITIEGEGIIDGNGLHWWTLYKNIRHNRKNPLEIPGVSEILSLNTDLPMGSGGGGRETGFLRPPLVQFRSCRNVNLEGITFRNSPFWNTHFLYSRNVKILNCHFLNPPDSPNTDGLNIDSSSEVEISGCVFDVGDDCLCLKSGSDSDGRRIARPTENVTVRNCSMESGHGALVVGSEISGGVRNIRVEDCRFTGTDRGIRIKARRGRGGYVANIDIQNIKMTEVSFPLVINMFYRCGAEPEEAAAASSDEILPVNEKTPRVQNINISKVTGTGVRVAAWVKGLPEQPIENLNLSDWKLSFAPGNRNIEKFEPAMDFAATRVPGSGYIGFHVKEPVIRNFNIEDPSIPRHR